MQLADLAGHQQVHYVRHFGALDPGPAYLQHERLQYFALPGAVTVNHTDSYETACLQGLGLIQAPRFGLQHYFASGALVEVLPGLPQPAMPVWLLYPHPAPSDAAFALGFAVAAEFNHAFAAATLTASH